MKRMKKGFTLAEVLITLAIIGIVAALTVPTLMTDSRYQLVSSRIAKFVSVTEDAALAQAAMNGEITAGDLDMSGTGCINNLFIDDNDEQYVTSKADLCKYLCNYMNGNFDNYVSNVYIKK